MPDPVDSTFGAQERASLQPLAQALRNGSEQRCTGNLSTEDCATVMPGTFPARNQGLETNIGACDSTFARTSITVARGPIACAALRPSCDTPGSSRDATTHPGPRDSGGGGITRVDELPHSRGETGDMNIADRAPRDDYNP